MYSTELCPRNQEEWNLRSSAINCTNTNGYMCLPNDNLTKLLEFCYIYTRTPIQKGTENLEAATGIIEHCGLLTGVSIINFMASQNLRCLIFSIFLFYEIVFILYISAYMYQYQRLIYCLNCQRLGKLILFECLIS